MHLTNLSYERVLDQFTYLTYNGTILFSDTLQLSERVFHYAIFSHVVLTSDTLMSIIRLTDDFREGVATQYQNPITMERVLLQLASTEAYRN